MNTDYDLEKDILAGQEADDPSGQYYSVPLPQLLPFQEKALELLSHLASYSELLVVITGPEGAGKSVLAKALAAQREVPETSLFLMGDLMLGMSAILTAIASHWDMPRLPDDLIAARDAIRAQASTREEQGESLLVIIDQAEQLDAETLNSIANFALIAPQALSFALFGRAGFERDIRESPANAPVHHHELEPLSNDDCQILLQQVYSPDADLQLSEDDVNYISEQSQGWPAAMLRIADDLFLNSVNNTENTPPVAEATRFPVTHILAIAVVAVALLLSFLYSGYNREAEELVVADGAESESSAVQSPESKQPPVARTPLSTLEVETTVINPPVVAAEPDYNYVPAKSADTDAAADDDAEPRTTAIDLPVAAVDAVAAQPENMAEKPQRPESPLLSVRSGYVVQLFGSYQQANAARFAETWSDKVAGTLYRYETTHQGKPWFVVVAATYGSRDEAEAAVNAMPPALRKQSPWIRDIAAVQEAIR